MKAKSKLKLRIQKKSVEDKIDNAIVAGEAKIYKSTSSKKAKKAARTVLIVVLCAAFLFCIFNINYLTPSKMREHMKAVFANFGHGDGFPYRFSSDAVLDFSVFNGSDFCVLTNNELIILNHSAKPVLQYVHSMSNPVVKYSKDRILLFDQGGYKAVILNQSGQVISFPNDDKIICADISSSGNTVFAVNTESSKDMVYVYSFSGKKLMRWEKGSGYIIDTAISPSGNSICVGIIDTVDAVQTVSVLSFNVSNAKQKGHRDFKDEVLYDISYLNANDLSVLTNHEIHVLNAKCEVKNHLELSSFNHLQLFADANGHLIDVYSQYNNGKYTVDVYNSSLKKVYTKECDGEVNFVYSGANTLSVLYNDNHCEMNMIGGKVTYSVQFDTSFSYVLHKGKMIYVCSGGAVERAKAAKQ